MIIVSQNGEALVNMDRVALIFPTETDEGKYDVFAANDFTFTRGVVLGTYSSMNRAKGLLGEMLRYYEHEGMKGMEHTVYTMPEDEAFKAWDPEEGDKNE